MCFYLCNCLLKFLYKLIPLPLPLPRKGKSFLIYVVMDIPYLSEKNKLSLVDYLSAIKQEYGFFINWIFLPSNLLALQALSENRFNFQSLQGVSNKSISSKLPNIDISVVSFNGVKWIDGFMKSLIFQDYPLSKIHMVIIDHGSDDGSFAKLVKWQKLQSSKFRSFRIVKQANLGFGAGHHRAITMGRSPYCLVTNLDLEFLSNSIPTIIKAAIANNDHKVASWEFRQIPYEHPKYYDPVTLEKNWSSHACILISRDAYEVVGGYDEKFFMYAEDVELSYRFRSYGYILKYVPGAVVRHFAYEFANQIKPVQFINSILGNYYIRLRYGRFQDVLIGFFTYILLIIKPEPYPGARKALFNNTYKLVINSLHFIRGKGNAQAYYPLRGLDYEMIREGAFFKTAESAYNKNVPKVSIITRTYKGRSALLSQAIQSVFNQTYSSIELLVVEDGGKSQQELVRKMIAKSAANVSLRFIANRKLGRSAAGNTGLANSSGKFIMFLDDDDLLFADHVEILASHLIKSKKFSAVYSLAFEVLTEFNSSKTRYKEQVFYINNEHRQIWNYAILKKYNFMPIQTVLFKRELYQKRGGFDENLEALEDWNLWLTYGFKSQFLFLNKLTSLYRTPFDKKDQLKRQKLLSDSYDKALKSAMSRIKNESK